MAHTRAVVGAAVALAFAGCSRERPNAEATIAVTPAQAVAGRQAAMRLAAANFQVMRTAAENGADVKTFAGPARALAQWAKAVPGMFPAGTGPGTANTRARADIWTKRADFEQRAADFEAAATRLAELAEAGNMAEAARQWDATWRTCGACHDRYRSEIPSQ